MSAGSTKQAIRDGLAEVKEQIAVLERQRDALEVALETFKGKAPEPPKDEKGKRRYRDAPKHRRPLSDTRKLVEAWFRQNPTRKVSAHALAKEMDSATATTQQIIDQMLKEKLVAQVDKTPRGKPIVRHAPVTVVPGEGVRVSERVSGTKIA